MSLTINYSSYSSLLTISSTLAGSIRVPKENTFEAGVDDSILSKKSGDDRTIVGNSSGKLVV